MNSPEQAEAKCRYCRRMFTYEVVVAQRAAGPTRVLRQVCDGCRVGRLHWTKRKVKKVAGRKLRQRREYDAERHLLRVSARDFPEHKPGEFVSREALAEKLGLSEKQVRTIEERALEKLRSSPALQEAYVIFKKSGKPGLEQLWEYLRVTLRRRDEDRVMEMQQELMQWWRIHAQLAEMGNAEAALRVRRAITECRRLLLRELGRK